HLRLAIAQHTADAFAACRERPQSRQPFHGKNTMTPVGKLNARRAGTTRLEQVAQTHFDVAESDAGVELEPVDARSYDGARRHRRSVDATFRFDPPAGPRDVGDERADSVRRDHETAPALLVIPLRLRTVRDEPRPRGRLG